MSEERKVRVDVEWRPRRPWVLPLAGLVVGVAIGVVFFGTGESLDPSGEATPVSSSAIDSTSSTMGAEEGVRVSDLEAELASVRQSLADAERELFELRVRGDPGSVAVVVGCDASVGNETSVLGGEPIYLVGPVWFYGLEAPLATGDPTVQVFAGVEASERVTLVVPESERDRYSLLWDPARAFDGTVGSGSRAVTLEACDGFTTLFVGGFTAADDHCAPLDVYVEDEPEPLRVVLPFGGLDCPDDADAFVRPAPGPLPDTVGMQLRDARLALRLVEAVPVVTDGEPSGPQALVWAQEPNDADTYETGTVVGLRTCEPGHDIVATYQQRLEGTVVRLVDAWVATANTEIQFTLPFVSARVIGGDDDGQIATWALPAYGGTADVINTPGLSIPANPVAERLPFGDRRYGAADFSFGDPSVESWLDFGGAVASQRCVEVATRRGAAAAFAPPTILSDRQYIEVGFPDGAQHRISVPLSVDVTSVAVAPYTSGQIPGFGRDFVILYETIDAVIDSLQATILGTYTNPAGNEVQLLGGFDPEIHYLAFQFGPWAVLVYDYTAQGVGSQMSPADHQIWVDSLTGTLDINGYLNLAGLPPLELAEAGQHAGPSVGLTGTSGSIQLILGTCEPEVADDYDGGTFDSWCDETGTMYVHASGTPEFVTLMRDELRIEG